MYFNIDLPVVSLPASKTVETFWNKYISRVLEQDDVVRWDRFEEGCLKYCKEHLALELSAIVFDSPFKEENFLLAGLLANCAELKPVTHTRELVLRPFGEDIYRGVTVSRRKLEDQVKERTMKEYFIALVQFGFDKLKTQEQKVRTAYAQMNVIDKGLMINDTIYLVLFFKK